MIAQIHIVLHRPVTAAAIVLPGVAKLPGNIEAFQGEWLSAAADRMEDK